VKREVEVEGRRRLKFAGSKIEEVRTGGSGVCRLSGQNFRMVSK
jgi:hypothetical protein